MEERHRPGHEAAPVVAGEDGALDSEHVEEADEIAGQVMDVVGADLGGTAIRMPFAATTRVAAPLIGLPLGWKRAAGVFSGGPFRNWLPGPDSNQRPIGYT